MKKCGLFFGSFNPIHIGHLMIANYMVEFSDLDQIWFVVSPHNPLKEKKSLLADYHRLEMVEMAIKDDLRFHACDIEFRLKQPSYTINTLIYLKEKYPYNHFSIIMGADSLLTFRKWKNFEQIMSNYERYVYPRPNVPEQEIQTHKNIRLVDAPQIEISASFIRESIKNKKDVRYFLPVEVYEYMRDMHFYEK